MLELIDAEQLRLTQDEVRDVVELRGQSMTDDALESLYRKTQGWAAGGLTGAGWSGYPDDGTFSPVTVECGAPPWCRRAYQPLKRRLHIAYAS